MIDSRIYFFWGILGGDILAFPDAMLTIDNRITGFMSFINIRCALGCPMKISPEEPTPPPAITGSPTLREVPRTGFLLSNSHRFNSIPKRKGVEESIGCVNPVKRRSSVHGDEVGYS